MNMLRLKQALSYECSLLKQGIVVLCMASVVIFSCKDNKKNTELNEVFQKTTSKLKESTFLVDLEQGSFFENPYGFYVLLTMEDLYIITSDTSNLCPKFMLHFIKEDNTFDNLSFVFSSKELITAFRNLKVAKIRIPPGDYRKLRMGQYTKEGNIWAQEFSPFEVRANPLLRYDNEFKSVPE